MKNYPTYWLPNPGSPIPINPEQRGERYILTDDLVEAIAEAAVEFELCPAGVATFLEALGLPTTHRVSMAVTMDASIEVDVPLNFDRDEFDDGHIDALLRQSIVDKLDDMGGTLLDHDALHLVVRVT